MARQVLVDKALLENHRRKFFVENMAYQTLDWYLQKDDATILNFFSATRAVAISFVIPPTYHDLNSQSKNHLSGVWCEWKELCKEDDNEDDHEEAIDDFVRGVKNYFKEVVEKYFAYSVEVTVKIDDTQILLTLVLNG